MELELVSFKLCPYVQRAVITLLHKGVPCRIRYVDLSDPPDWFLALSPTKKVPLLVADGKHVIFESSVINEFIDEVTPGSMHPSSPIERAQNRGWIAFGSDILMDTLHMTTAADEAAFRDVVERHNNSLAEVEAVLGDGPFFNGSELSLVDAAFAPLFARLELIGHLATVLDKDRLPKIARWSDRLLGLDEVKRSSVPEFADLFKALVQRRQGYLASLQPGFVEVAGVPPTRY